MITSAAPFPAPGQWGQPGLRQPCGELAIDTAGRSWRLAAAPSAGLPLKTGDEPNVITSLAFGMFLLLYIPK